MEHKHLKLTRGDIEYETMLKLCHDNCPRYETCVKEGYKSSKEKCDIYKDSVEKTIAWAQRENFYKKKGGK